MKKEICNFLDLFQHDKPIIGMIHLNGNDDIDILTKAIREVGVYTKNGIDAVLIENYFGDVNNVEQVLDYLYNYQDSIIYGVNVLGDYNKAFELANKYAAKFIQIDSVAGHLNFFNDCIFENDIKYLRSSSEAFVLGGVRFKYQPYLSGRSLEEDLVIGMNRCDAIVVTGTGTGKETDLEKIKKFREILKNYPLIIGAGLNPDNCEKQLLIADAGIVGSYLKTQHKDYGDVSLEYVDELVGKVKRLRR